MEHLVVFCSSFIPHEENPKFLSEKIKEMKSIDDSLVFETDDSLAKEIFTDEGFFNKEFITSLSKKTKREILSEIQKLGNPKDKYEKSLALRLVEIKAVSFDINEILAFGNPIYLNRTLAFSEA